jgi:hypothetical protein
MFTFFEKRRAAFVYPVSPAPRTAVLVPWFKSASFNLTWRGLACVGLTRFVPVRLRSRKLTPSSRCANKLTGRFDWIGRLAAKNSNPRTPDSSGTVEIFAGGWSESAAAFAPSAIAATPAQLRLLASVEIPSLRHAVVALTRPEEPRLSETDREALWAAFHVPVFEQIIGERGGLLGAECEAHAGFHLHGPGVELPQGMLASGDIECSPCACGLSTPRLVPTQSPTDLALRSSQRRPLRAFATAAAGGVASADDAVELTPERRASPSERTL